MMAAMATVTAAVEGTDNNQPKGAAEKTMVAVRVTVAETTTATEKATVTGRITTPTLMTVHQ